MNYQYCIPGDDLWPLKEMPLQQDEPFMGVNYSIMKAAMEKVREKGINVVLTGHAGDHLLTGNRFYLADFLLSLRLRELVYELKGLSEYLGRSPVTVFRWYALMPLLPLSVQSFLRVIKGSVKRGDIRPGDIAPWINPHFSKSLQLKERGRKYQVGRRFSEHARQKEYADLSHDTLRGHQLWIDQYIALPFCIQTRHPFLDIRLLHFTMAVPIELKTRSGVIKIILRNALAEMLPELIRRRNRKTTLDPLLRRGIEEEWSQIHHILRKPYISALRYADRDKLLCALQQYRLYDTGGKIWLWNTLALEMWLKQSKVGPSIQQDMIGGDLFSKKIEVPVLQPS